MSVINKMLRDLDQRHAPDAQSLPHASAARLRHGTASLAQEAQRTGRHAPARWWLAGGAIGLGLLAVVWWWLGSGRLAAPAPAPAAAAAAASSPAVIASAPVSMVSVVADPVLQMPAPLAAVRVSAPVIARPVSAPVAVVSAASVPAPAPVPASASVASAAHANPPKAAVQVSVAPVDPQSTAQRQQQAARDALAQAQMLWNAGSHDAATELLQQAVGMSERSASSSPSPANTQTLVGLVRELARMHLADGRASAAADLLARLQPQLGQEADIWALRANAAQRLGRHQESVSDYTTALQSRPNEQRWLLGAAVSMAAQGQIANATAMAERARAVGPIAREVQAYLRQAGVQLKEP